MFFLCGLADKYSKAIRHDHDISDFKIPLDIIDLHFIYFKGKSIFHNIIRDEIYRILQERNLHYRLESNRLLPDSPGQRPLDLVMIPKFSIDNLFGV